MADPQDTNDQSDDAVANEQDPGKVIRRATGLDDGATIAATDPAVSNDHRYEAGAQTGDTEAETGNTEGETSNT